MLRTEINPYATKLHCGLDKDVNMSILLACRIKEREHPLAERGFALTTFILFLIHAVYFRLNIVV